MEKTTSDLMRGNLDLMVLSTLSQGAKYGYLIQQSVSDATAGQVAVPAGTLYPLLHRLEAGGLVRSRWDHTTERKRKWYELTPAGRKCLHRQADQWRQYVECLWQMLAPVLGRPAPSLGGG